MQDPNDNWRPPSLSGLTPMVFNTGLTHLGSEASNQRVNYPYSGSMALPALSRQLLRHSHSCLYFFLTGAMPTNK